MKKNIFVILVLILSTIMTHAAMKTQLEAASFLADKGIIALYTTQQQDQGMSQEDFYRLGDTITRQEVMKVIAKLSGDELAYTDDNCISSFGDVSGWGCKYIEWALNKKLIAQNANFRPTDNITKTEAMKLILLVQKIEKIQVTDNWQKDYMDTALFYEIIDAPYTDYDSQATRGWIFQIATVTIEEEEEIKVKMEQKKMSDEVL